ncbi:MAG: TIGR02186 family protein [Deltaproteobacteria bacterium]|nr:TIGR02186 family protein [Deltaproteobacteria bacterium]
MKPRYCVRSILDIFFALLIVGVSCSGVMASSMDLKLDPSEIHIGVFFEGASMSITATVPSQSLSIIEIKGESRTQKLLRKGRKGGLWMNVGEIKVEASPCTYLVLTSGSGPELAKALGGEFGYPALKKTIRFSGKFPKSGPDLLFDQFIKLKESEKLYGIFPGSVKAKETVNERDMIKGIVDLPANIAPGTYQVVLSVIKDNKLLGQETTSFNVKMKGLPELLYSMAFEHALLYGCLAVVIAIICGFLMGFIFGGKGAH